MDFRELAISDGGHLVPVQVYQRLTGRVIWTQPDDMPYPQAIEQAKAIVLNGLAPFNDPVASGEVLQNCINCDRPLKREDFCEFCNGGTDETGG